METVSRTPAGRLMNIVQCVSGYTAVMAAGMSIYGIGMMAGAGVIARAVGNTFTQPGPHSPENLGRDIEVINNSMKTAMVAASRIIGKATNNYGGVGFWV